MVKNKIIAILLALVLVFELIPISAVAVDAGQTTYVIRSSANPNLVIAESTADEGAAVFLEEYKSEDKGQQWTMLEYNNGYVQFVNVESGYVLDLSGYGNVFAGLRSIVWNNNGCITEYWSLEHVGDDFLIRCKADSSLALDANAYADTIRAGTNIQLWSDNYDSTQIWTLDCVGSNTANSTGMNTPLGANANFTSSEVFVEAIKNNVPVRTEPNSKASVVMRLAKEDTLHVTGSVQNKANNTWFTVDYGGQTYYVYSQNVQEHIHNFQTNPSASGVKLCSCGYYSYAPTGEANISAVATAGWLLGEDVISAAIAAGSAKLAEGLAVAFPYVGIVVVGGMIVYIAYNATFTRCYFSDKVKTMEEFGSGSFENGKYYYAMSSGNATSPLLVCYASPIDEDIALDYLFCKVTARDILNGVAISGIYTPRYDDAIRLAKRFAGVKTVEGVFDYGDSNGNKMPEIDKDAEGNYKEGHFFHFHLSNSNNSGIWKKKNVHIWYGDPYSKTNLPAVA